MKKILYIIGLLMFATLVFSPKISMPVMGANTTDECSGSGEGNKEYSDLEKCIPLSPGSIFNKINGAITGGKDDWTDVFGNDDPEKLGQNIYKKIYDKTVYQPEKKSIKNISGQYGLPEGEMFAVLSGSIEPILKRKPTLNQKDLLQKVQEIQKKYELEKDILALQADMEATVQPNEMFANGSIQDSGIDLINDLNLIEELLFLRQSPIDVGAMFDPSEVKDTSEGFGGSENNDENGQSEDQKEKKDDKNQTPKNKKSENTAQNKSQLNPNLCFASSALDKAFDEHKKTNPEGKTGSSADALTSSDSGGDSNALEAKVPNIAPVKPAPPANWSSPNTECQDILCLSVDFVKKPVSLYQVSDNCIACHVEKINEKLKETIDHNLIPGKVTGNLLEPEICKKMAANSLFNLGLNFYAISQPVRTPPNDDLISNADIKNEWKNFIETYKPFEINKFGNIPEESKTSNDAYPVNLFDQATKASIANAGPEAPYSEVTKAIEQQVQRQQQQIDEAIEVAEAAVQGENNSGFYQNIQRELDQMNAHFFTFQKILHSLHEQVDGVSGGQACTDLKNKKQCD